MPGVYYFDFRNTTVTQGCGNVGVDSDPGVFDFGDENLAALTHQWCIRGQNVSDGNQTTTAQKRPHIVGGTPFGTEATGNGGLQCVAGRRRTAGTRCPTRSRALLSAATASSTDFTNPNNAKAIDGSNATASWAGRRRSTRRTAPPRAPRSSRRAPTTSRPRRTRPARSTARSRSHTLASVSAAVTAAAATSTQVAVAGHRRLREPGQRADHRRIGDVGHGREPEPDGDQRHRPRAPRCVTSGTDDFANKANATGAIDGTVAGHTLASVTSALTAAAAASSQVSGSNDFANPGNGRTIGDAATTSATIANQSTTSNPANAASTQVVTSGHRRLRQQGQRHRRDRRDGRERTRSRRSRPRSRRLPRRARRWITPGTDDFTNPGNGRVIGDSATTSETIASADPDGRSRHRRRAPRSRRPAPTTSRTRPTPLALIDGTFATHTLASVTGVAHRRDGGEHAVVSGTDDFANPGNGRTIGDSQTTVGNRRESDRDPDLQLGRHVAGVGRPRLHADRQRRHDRRVDCDAHAGDRRRRHEPVAPRRRARRTAAPTTSPTRTTRPARPAVPTRPPRSRPGTSRPPRPPSRRRQGTRAPTPGNVAFTNPTQAYVLDNGGDSTTAATLQRATAQLILTGYPDVPANAIPTGRDPHRSAQGELLDHEQHRAPRGRRARRREQPALHRRHQGRQRSLHQLPNGHLHASRDVPEHRWRS